MIYFPGGGTDAEDFIVEQGTSGTWNYRKWNSGFAECWGRHQVTKTNYTTVNGFYGYRETFYLPFTFTATARKVYSIQIGTGFSIAATGSISDTENYVTVHGLGNTSGLQSITAQIYAWGNWK